MRNRDIDETDAAPMTDTTIAYYCFRFRLQQSGSINMYGAAPYLANQFSLSLTAARKIVQLWMDHYDTIGKQLGEQATGYTPEEQ